MKTLSILKALVLFALVMDSCIAYAENIGCVTTAWKLIGANHKVCVEAFHDPKVPGEMCIRDRSCTVKVFASVLRLSKSNKLEVSQEILTLH